MLKGRSWKFWVVIAAVMLLCVFPTTLAILGDGARAVGILPTFTPEPTVTNTPEPTATPEPSATPLPTSTLEPMAQLEADIFDALGSLNRDETERVRDIRLQGERLVVEFAINDNFEIGMIRFGARSDVRDILEIAAQSPVEFTSVVVWATFSMVDLYGNVSEDWVIQALYSREALGRVDWDNFLADNVWAIADSATIHPEFQ